MLVSNPATILPCRHRDGRVLPRGRDLWLCYAYWAVPCVQCSLTLGLFWSLWIFQQWLWASTFDINVLIHLGWVVVQSPRAAPSSYEFLKFFSHWLNILSRSDSIFFFFFFLKNVLLRWPQLHSESLRPLLVAQYYRCSCRMKESGGEIIHHLHRLAGLKGGGRQKKFVMLLNITV